MQISLIQYCSFTEHERCTLLQNLHRTIVLLALAHIIKKNKSLKPTQNYALSVESALQNAPRMPVIINK